jgi:hypothetical protein
MADPKITITAVDQTKAAFASVARGFDSLKGKAEAAALPFTKFSAAIGALGVTGVGLAFKSAVDAADNLNKLSQKVGVSVESLSTLRFAAELADVDIQSLGDGLRKLGVNMADAQKGTGEAVDAFKALKIGVESSRGELKLTEDVLLEIAEKFSGFADGANKTALAVKLFGRAGAELIPFLNQGRAGIEDLRKEAEKLGISLSSASGRQAEQFNDNLTALGRSVSSLAQDMANSLLPSLVAITDAMRLGAQQGGIFVGVLEGLRRAFSETFLGAHAPTIDATNKALTEQLKVVQSLEAQLAKARPGSLGAAETEKALAAARRGVEELKKASVQAQTLDQFETPGGLNPPVKKPPAPALVDTAGADRAAKAAQAERDRIAKDIAASLQAQQDIEDEARRLGNEFLERQGKAAEKNRELAQSFKDLGDPTAEFVRQLTEVRRLLAEGFLTQDQAVAAEFAIQLQIDKVNNLGEETKKTKSLVEELGLTFASAFEDAISGGNSFRDILKGIQADLLKFGTRKLVTEPLLKSFSEGNTSSNFSSASSDFFSGLLKFGSSLFANANGGLYKVGGSGGTDSQIVAFKATPGEEVEVRPQGRGAGAALTIINNFTLMQPASRETQLQIASNAAMSIRRANRNL